MLYDVGDSLKIRTTTPFQETESGALIDPATVTFTVRDPLGTRTEYVYGVAADVIREAAGDYSMIVRPDCTGRWRFAVVGVNSDGVALSAAEGYFEVRPPLARE